MIGTDFRKSVAVYGECFRVQQGENREVYYRKPSRMNGGLNLGRGIGDGKGFSDVSN